MVEVARREPRETPDGRLMSFLLNNPTCDGGQWDMVVNLVEKYGVMPKKCFPETYSSENSLRMNRLLKSKVLLRRLRTVFSSKCLNERAIFLLPAVHSHNIPLLTLCTIVAP